MKIWWCLLYFIPVWQQCASPLVFVKAKSLANSVNMYAKRLGFCSDTKFSLLEILPKSVCSQVSRWHQGHRHNTIYYVKTCWFFFMPRDASRTHAELVGSAKAKTLAAQFILGSAVFQCVSKSVRRTNKLVWWRQRRADLLGGMKGNSESLSAGPIRLLCVVSSRRHVCSSLTVLLSEATPSSGWTLGQWHLSYPATRTIMVILKRCRTKEK